MFCQQLYIDEIAVNRDARLHGIGKLLGRSYLGRAMDKGLDEVALRTDERNSASMALFKSIGFSPFNPPINDPEFPARTYLKAVLKGYQGGVP